MTFHYLVTPVVFLSLLFTPASAQSPVGDPNPWPTDTNERRSAVKTLVAHYSEPHGLSRAKQDFIISIINCENKELEPTLQSRIIQKDGTREESYGLAQIHLPSHPTVSHAQATDPHFAIEFIVTNVAAGHENMWTCARMLKDRWSS